MSDNKSSNTLYPIRTQSLRATLTAASEKRIAKLMDTANREKKRADDLQKQLDTIAYAAHMPDDYEFGLASWINQRLYACYIGASVSPHITEQIENGTLTFPNAPAWKQLELALPVVNAADKYDTATKEGVQCDAIIEMRDTLKAWRAAQKVGTE